MKALALEDGWISVRNEYPAKGEVVFVLHFGLNAGFEILDTAVVDDYGLCPHAKDGGHGKRSTITHWRRIPWGVDLDAELERQRQELRERKVKCPDTCPGVSDLAAPYALANRQLTPEQQAACCRFIAKLFQRDGWSGGGIPSRGMYEDNDWRLAVEVGILLPQTVVVPCNDSCSCVDLQEITPEHPATCYYRLAPWLAEAAKPTNEDTT